MHAWKEIKLRFQWKSSPTPIFFKETGGVAPTGLLLILKFTEFTECQQLYLGYMEGNKEDHENYTKLFSHWSNIGW